MKFRYADELKAKFDVKGHFYNLRIGDLILPCRSFLEIKRKRGRLITALPDAVIVMMNPGSSKPQDSTYDPITFNSLRDYNTQEKSLVLTQPDSTQYQIMRLMLLSKWQFVRIINLSDLRNGNSSIFQQLLKDTASIDPSAPHGLLHAERVQELEEALTTKNNLIIGAWGNIPELRDTAEGFLKFYPDTIFLESGAWPYCRHASPMMKKHKIAWIKDMRVLIRHSQK